MPRPRSNAEPDAEELPATRGNRVVAARAGRIGAVAAGALAAGAVAVGALAIGRLAIGSLRAGEARIGRLKVKRLEIDELIVRRSDPADGKGAE